MWIATDTTMPNEMEEVLVYDDETGVFIGHYFESVKSFIRTLDGARLPQARFWMPIPETP